MRTDHPRGLFESPAGFVFGLRRAGQTSDEPDYSEADGRISLIAQQTVGPRPSDGLVSRTDTEFAVDG